MQRTMQGSVQFSSVAQMCLTLATPWTAACQASLSIINSLSLRRFTVNFSIHLSNEYSGLISFRIHWLDLLQSKVLPRVFFNTTVKEHQFFSTQLSLWSSSHIHAWLLEKPYLWLDGPLSVMSMLFNVLSRLVIAFLPKSNCRLISWLQSPSTVILEPKKIKCHCFCFFLIYLPWSDGARCHDLSFLDIEF